MVNGLSGRSGCGDGQCGRHVMLVMDCVEGVEYW